MTMMWGLSLHTLIALFLLVSFCRVVCCCVCVPRQTTQLCFTTTPHPCSPPAVVVPLPHVVSLLLLFVFLLLLLLLFLSLPPRLLTQPKGPELRLAPPPVVFMLIETVLDRIKEGATPVLCVVVVVVVVVVSWAFVCVWNPQCACMWVDAPRKTHLVHQRLHIIHIGTSQMVAHRSLSIHCSLSLSLSHTPLVILRIPALHLVVDERTHTDTHTPTHITEGRHSSNRGRVEEGCIGIFSAMRAGCAVTREENEFASPSFSPCGGAPGANAPLHPL